MRSAAVHYITARGGNKKKKKKTVRALGKSLKLIKSVLDSLQKKNRRACVVCMCSKKQVDDNKRAESIFKYPRSKESGQQQQLI